ncbi:MAG: DUF3786 domain-containing protein [Chloroflexi bacterium]|nr:DUF3786 domain-containing protein [Chloroflexota bacterium]
MTFQINMTDKRFLLPEERGYDKAYELSYKLACDKLVKIDVEEQCRRSGTECRSVDAHKLIVIKYLNQTYFVTLPDVKVTLPGSPDIVSIRDKLLMLHYFLTARGTPPTNKMVAFKELPEGKVYSPTFEQRSIRPLLNAFGKEPRLLIEVAEKLGGRRADYGDVAMTIDAFSRVPVTIILWGGDDEFAPQGSITFDANITDYLPTEDITVLCETIAWKLVRSAKSA